MNRLPLPVAFSLLLLFLLAAPTRAEEETVLDLGTDGQKAPTAAEKAVTPPEGEKTLDRILPKLAERITVGGQVRMRYEYRRRLDYELPSTRADNDMVLVRTRLHLKARITGDIDAFVQFQDSRVWGEEAGTTSDEAGLDLHQGYFEVRNLFDQPVSIRIGRQELLYGDQRLVSPLDWGNTGRAFDAAKVRYQPSKEFWIDGFGAVVVEAGTPNDERRFGGLYASLSRFQPAVVETYLFYRHFGDRGATSELGRMGSVRDATLGFRTATKKGGIGGYGPGNVDGTLEAAYQAGNFSRDTTRAYALAGKCGYTLPGLPWSPRVGLEYSLGSGDNNPTDEEHETFDPLFPFGHFYQGYLDVFSWKNGHDLQASLGVQPAQGWKVACSVHGLWLHEEKDAWYNAGGGVIRQDMTGDSGTEIGLEIDLHAKYNIGKAFFIWFGYSHLFPGKFVRRTSKAPGDRDFDMDWLFFQAGVNF